MYARLYFATLPSAVIHTSSFSFAPRLGRPRIVVSSTTFSGVSFRRGFFFTNPIIAQLGHHTPYLYIYAWKGSDRDSSRSETAAESARDLRESESRSSPRQADLGETNSDS